MPRRNVADITSDYIFLAQRLAFMLSRAVIEVVMNHRTAAIVAQAGGRHRRSLQVAAQIFHAVPGSPGLLRKMHLPVPAVLCLQIAPPLAFIANVTQPRQLAGHDPNVAVAQKADNRASPDSVLNVETGTRDGDVDMRVLIELAAVSVQGAEYANLDTLPACPLQHGAGGAAEQLVEQRPVVVKERPQQVWHGKSDVLPFAVGQNVLLLSNPLLG